MASGMDRARAPNNDDDDDNDVAQHGGHTPADTKSWFTAYTSLIFDIHVVVN